jgi:hypothetical protein
MAFGQSSGTPASGRQVQELLALLNAAGHRDFRDARGPMGFTQRQAGGKFTAAEAEEFIAQLQQAAYETDRSPVGPRPRLSAADKALQALPTERLAAELQRRGWIVIEP